jgi:hypothetical protein
MAEDENRIVQVTEGYVPPQRPVIHAVPDVTMQGGRVPPVAPVTISQGGPRENGVVPPSPPVQRPAPAPPDKKS